MKKFLIVFLCLFLPVSALADKLPRITYEQVVSGEYYGQEVEINAIAVPMASYYNLTHFWSVEKEDGTFEIVDKSETRWCLSEEDYKKASNDEKKAIDEQDVLTLTVYFKNNGTPHIREFRLPGAMTSEQELECFIYAAFGVLALLIVLLIIMGKRKQNEYIPSVRKPQVIKTKFVDSSHTATSKTKTGSAVGRAAIGGLVAGPVGALVGAGTAKQKTVERHTTTFMVYYDDGSRKVETVSNGSYQYDRYMELLDMGD